VEEERGLGGTAFEPVSGQEAVEQVRRFLLAQGWAGLPAGDHLGKLADQGVRPEQVLWWVPGPAAEARAVALLHEGLLGLLLSSSDERPAARALLEGHRSQFQRISVLEGQVDFSGLDEFVLHRRELAVAPELRVPKVSLPETRPAQSKDIDQIHHVYEHVSWMRQDSAEAWRERLQRQRCWVAELAGQVVAVARWTMSFGPWVEIGGVATDPEYRRCGAATAVTLAAATAALAEGRLACLRYGDPALASLYHPLGFEHVGRELVFYRGS